METIALSELRFAVRDWIETIASEKRLVSEFRNFDEEAKELIRDSGRPPVEQ